LAKRRSRRKARATERGKKSSARQVDLAEEYAYVADDLIRIAIIAAVLVGGLIALSFFLH
jgi:hypothetical protein